jgi:hypothetical protein
MLSGLISDDEMGPASGSKSGSVSDEVSSPALAALSGLVLDSSKAWS